MQKVQNWNTKSLIQNVRQQHFSLEAALTQGKQTSPTLHSKTTLVPTVFMCYFFVHNSALALIKNKHISGHANNMVTLIKNKTHLGYEIDYVHTQFPSTPSCSVKATYLNIWSVPLCAEKILLLLKLNKLFKPSSDQLENASSQSWKQTVFPMKNFIFKDMWFSQDSYATNIWWSYRPWCIAVENALMQH